MPKGKELIKSLFFFPDKLKLCFLYFKVLAHDVGALDFIWCLHYFYSFFYFYFCYVLPPIPLLLLSSPAWHGTQEISSFLPLLQTNLSEKWGGGSQHMFASTITSFQTFLTTLNVTHPCTMWRDKLHLFCVRKEQKCIWPSWGISPTLRRWGNRATV